MESNYAATRDIRMKNGQVQVVLKGALDVTALSLDLREKGYYLANDPWDIDSQGWGSEEDLEGYYPYWVFRDGDKWVFAFTPEGYHINGKKNERAAQNTAAVMGEETSKIINRWLPYLESWTAES